MAGLQKWSGIIGGHWALFDVQPEEEEAPQSSGPSRQEEETCIKI